MFEKESEEYTVENVCSSCYFEKPCENKCEAFGCADSKTYVLKAFKDGAEFGYNKANEWHKDLPTEDINLAIIEVEDCGYLLCEYRNGVWYDNGSSAICKDWITRNIKGWKEIVLPELKESE